MPIRQQVVWKNDVIFMIKSGLRFLVLVGLLLSIAACGVGGGGSASADATLKIDAANRESAMPDELVAPKVIRAKVVAEYPHDPKAYTQGLLFHNGKLYESTGQYGESTLRRVELETGRVEQQIKLSPKLFGEGLALCSGQLYQLTWMEGRCLVYDLDNFELQREINYKGEGWGLAQMGGEFYFSDGTNRIFVYDPKTFARKKIIEVRDDRGAVDQLNELEWIGNRLWANIYCSNMIALIDTQSGLVTHYIDCSELATRVTQDIDTDVFNGIAYDSLGNRLFVTGKNWDRLFQIEIPQI